MEVDCQSKLSHFQVQPYFSQSTKILNSRQKQLSTDFQIKKFNLIESAKNKLLENKEGIRNSLTRLNQVGTSTRDERVFNNILW